MININLKNMKKIFLNLFFLSTAIFLHSCEIDNYDGPNASLQGVIYDAENKPMQLEQGSGTGRIQMDEISWSETPIPFYYGLKMDGTYVNTKVFAATYIATLRDGAFYPIVGDTIKVVGNTTHDFHVVPYLNVEWVTEPQLLSDNKVTATFKFKRNPGPLGEAMPNLLDYQLFISNTPYVGNNNFDPTRVAAAVAVTNDKENTNITITSLQPMKYETTYYIRVGVRVSDTYKKYNYTPVKTVTVPAL